MCAMRAHVVDAGTLGTSKKKKMSRQGLKIAVKIGLSRRKFLNEESAKKYFNSLRKEVFELVEKLKIEYPNHKLDYSPESLKLIENIYFDYYCYLFYTRDYEY